MDIGSKIKNIRKEHQLTQQQFADRFHVTRQTVSNWENNKNYPDMETLRQISDEFDVSFDTLLKEDRELLEKIDRTSRAARGGKWAVFVLALLLCGVVVTGLVQLSRSVEITGDGERVNTDTDVRMLVDLPGEAPSRAITCTMEADEDAHREELKLMSRRSMVRGKTEGDIPVVFLEETPTVTLYFQDTRYRNLDPEQVEDLSVEIFNIYNIENVEMTDEEEIRSPAYQYEDGRISFHLEPDGTEEKMEEDIRKFCMITVRYVAEGKSFVSVTALEVMERREP